MLPIKVHLLTFNCAREPVDPIILADSLFKLPKEAAPLDELPEIVAISLQEVAPIYDAFLGGSRLEPFYGAVVEAVASAGRNWLVTRQESSADDETVAGQDHQEPYVMVRTHNVGMTAVMVLARPAMMSRIRSVITAEVGVGLWEMGNKGAAGVRLAIADGNTGPASQEVSFIAAHMAPMEFNTERRNQDWKDISRRLVFEPSGDDSSTATTAVAEDDDAAGQAGQPLLSRPSTQFSLYQPCRSVPHAIFFFGDLNYRTGNRVPGPDVHKTFPTTAKDAMALLDRDQLAIEMAAERTLHGLQEAPIRFTPTYKYTPESYYQTRRAGTPAPAPAAGEEKFHFAKRRWPSWCDRIVFAGAVTVNAYTSLPNQPGSDHRPVILNAVIGGQANGSAVDMRSEIEAGWRQRRQTVRALELAVGAGAWLTVSPAGQTTVLGLLLGLLLGYVAFAQ